MAVICHQQIKSIQKNYKQLFYFYEYILNEM